MSIMLPPVELAIPGSALSPVDMIKPTNKAATRSTVINCESKMDPILESTSFFLIIRSELS